jgi:hypothetical protein
MVHVLFMLDIKATKPQSEYGLFIAFSLQKWLYERASNLRYTQIACLVNIETECILRVARAAA